MSLFFLFYVHRRCAWPIYEVMDYQRIFLMWESVQDVYTAAVPYGYRITKLFITGI